MAIEKELLESPLPSESKLVHINSHLYNALLACKAAKPISQNPPIFHEKYYLAPGQRMEKTMELHKYQQKIGRKRKPNMLKYVKPTHSNFKSIITMGSFFQVC